MQEIFNEGRVVGLSAYELYARHHMETFKDDEYNLPATEREWLSSTISLGTSLLIHMTPTGNYSATETFSGGEYDGEYWGVEIKIPKRARLCAANTIIASIFLGEGEPDGDNPPFCKSVLDYGFLSSDIGEANFQNLIMNPEVAKIYDNQLREYMTLIDGVVIQPCTDYNDYVPDLHDTPKIRLLFRRQIKNDFYLLLSGFTDCSIINGTSVVTEGSKNTDRPETGDFLGPAVFPWSSKIIITTPSAALSRLFASKFGRTLYEYKNEIGGYSGVEEGYATDKRSIKQDPIVDYNHAFMKEFYDGSSALAEKMARLKEYTEQYAPIGDGINQFAVVSKDQGKYDLPSGYAARVNEEGDEFLFPLDCAAPGTIKGYPENVRDDELIAFPDNRPGSYPVIMNEDGTMYRVIIEDGQIVKVPVADMDIQRFTTTPTWEDPSVTELPRSGKFARLSIGREKVYETEWEYIDGEYRPVQKFKGWKIKKAAVPVIDYFYDDGYTEYTDDNIPPQIYYNDDDDNINGDYVNFYHGDYANYSAFSADRTLAVNFISMRTWSYMASYNSRLDLLGNNLRLFRNYLDTYYDYESRTNIPYIRISMKFEEPVHFESDVTIGTDYRAASLTVNGNIHNNGDLDTSNAEVRGHLILHKHVTTTPDYTCNGTKTNANAPAEGHIDIKGQGDDDDTKQFGIGIGANGAGYIRLTNGLRLYISNTTPTDTDVPVGSIGIGW